MCRRVDEYISLHLFYFINLTSICSPISKVICFSLFLRTTLQHHSATWLHPLHSTTKRHDSSKYIKNHILTTAEQCTLHFNEIEQTEEGDKISQHKKKKWWLQRNPLTCIGLQSCVSFLSSVIRYAIDFVSSLPITGESCRKYHFCRDKSFVATKLRLSRQTYFLSRQTFCRDNHTFVCCDKSKSVCKITKNYVCRYKYLPRQIFVATTILLSRQNVCRKKSILVAAPANGISQDMAFLSGSIDRVCCVV